MQGKDLNGPDFDVFVKKVRYQVFWATQDAFQEDKKDEGDMAHEPMEIDLKRKRSSSIESGNVDDGDSPANKVSFQLFPPHRS